MSNPTTTKHGPGPSKARGTFQSDNAVEQGVESEHLLYCRAVEGTTDIGMSGADVQRGVNPASYSIENQVYRSSNISNFS